MLPDMMENFFLKKVFIVMKTFLYKISDKNKYIYNLSQFLHV